MNKEELKKNVKSFGAIAAIVVGAIVAIIEVFE